MAQCQRVFFAIIFLCFSVPVLSAQDKLTAEDVVKRHLDSVGSASTLAGDKSRVFEGTINFQVLTGGTGKIDGKMAIVSEGHKIHLMMKFPSTNYHGEKLVCDGKKVQVAPSTDLKTRSGFGQFVHIQDVLLREGLLGGELSTAWPLFDLSNRKPKLAYDGLKEINGKPLHEIQYKPQKGQDVDIHLYFEPESFHHVLTVYILTIRAQLAEGGETAQAGNQQETHYRVEERFGDFKSAGGLTLPNEYRIHFTQDQQGGNTAILEWDTTATRIIENPTLDPRNFEVK
jgi:hypothetical protein